MHTIEFLNLFVANHEVLVYLVIFLVLIFEGEVILITTGVLMHLGILDIVPTLLVVIGGTMIKTLGGYSLGKVLYRFFGHHKFFRYLEKRLFYVLPGFRKKPFWSIFASKFIMGMNYLVILFSGYSNTKWKTFIKAETISTIIWAPLMIGLGYFFSIAALKFSTEINKFSLIIALCLIVFLLFDKLMAILYRVFEFIKYGNMNGDGE